MFLAFLIIFIGQIGLVHIETPFVAQNFEDVKRADSLLYFVTWRGLEIFNWHPSSPEFVSRLPTDGGAFGVDILGNHAYIADHYNGMCVVDISIPSLPEQVGYYNTEGRTWDVLIKDSIAYLADDENGLVILNVANPSTPYFISRCADIGDAISITLKDTLVYVGTSNSSLKIINVADLSNPYVIGEFPPGPFDYGLDAFIEDTMAYLNCGFQYGDSTIHFAVVNVVDPTSPTFISGLELGRISRGIEKINEFIYVNGAEDGIYIIDVTVPQAPFIIGRYIESPSGYGFVAGDNLLLVPHVFEGFSIADITNPKKPVRLYHHQNIGWRSFTCDDSRGYVYIVGQIQEGGQFWHSILNIVDVNDPLNPVINSGFHFTGRGSVYQGSIDYPYLAVVLSRGSPAHESLYTALIDVSDSHAPQLFRFATGGGPTEFRSPYLYSLQDSLMLVAEINHPLFWVDSLLLPGNGYDIAVRDSLAYVTIDNHIMILNVQTGQQLGTCYHGHSYAENISLDYPYIAVAYTPIPGSTYGFLLFDVSNPYVPLLLCDTLIYAFPQNPQSYAVVDCELRDTLLYFCRFGYGFDIWKVLYPDSIYRIINQETPYHARHIHVQGDVIFVLDNASLELYRVVGPGIQEHQPINENYTTMILKLTPNPFIKKTEIRYELRALSSHIENANLKIYDISGCSKRQFSLPVSNSRMRSSVSWDGTDDCGNRLPQGVYFIKLETERGACREKVVLLR